MPRASPPSPSFWHEKCHDCAAPACGTLVPEAPKLLKAAPAQSGCKSALCWTLMGLAQLAVLQVRSFACFITTITTLGAARSVLAKAQQEQHGI